MVELKFCGLTRATDTREAVQLGAAYVGAIFAGGPRERSASEAREILAPAAGTATRRVGVLGAQPVMEGLAIAERTGLDVLQLSYGAERERRVAYRKAFAGELWAVAHVVPGGETAETAAVWESWFDDGIDAIVLDAAVAGKLGGTGVALEWLAIAPLVQRLRSRGRVMLAGGLRPSNVALAIAQARPSGVDVSSGVESAPGIKDPERMRAFAAAARGLEVA